MRPSFRFLLTAALALPVVLPVALPAQTTLYANLTTTQEPGVVIPTLQNGQPRPTSFGFAMFEINAAQTQMTFTAWIYNIDVTGSQTTDVNDNLVAAHIHGSSTPFTPPATAGVIWGFFGAPFNNTGPNDGTLTPFVDGVGGIFTGTWNLAEGQNTTFAAQLENILAGRTYINFHTTQFGGGEIRGAILVTPEPSTFLLTAAGLGVAMLAMRRRRSS